MSQYAREGPQEDVILGLRRPGIPEQWLPVNAQTITPREGDFRYVVTSFEDETETVRTRERLLLTDHAFQSTADAIFVADDNMNLLYLNRAFSTITGFALEKWIERKLRELGDASLGAGLDKLKCSVKEGAWRCDFWGRRKHNQSFVAWLNVNAVHDAAGRLTHHVGSVSDVTERVHAEERVLHLAQHDVFTGLPNRTMLRVSLPHILAGAKRRGNEGGRSFVDLDHFKSVNDAMGHAAGDQVLIEVARRLRENQRESDPVSRLAGDEFVIALPDRSQALNVASVAEKVVHSPSVP